jgi:microcystin-dependent protein
MDVYSSNWNEADDSNSTPSPDGLPEGCAPSGVNNWARATMGALKRYVNQSIPKTTAGTSTAFTLAYSVAPGALVDGMTHQLEFDQANGAAATLNINALGAKPLHYYSAGAWRAVPAGLVGANEVRHVAYNSSAGAYRILGRPDTTGDWIPTGRSTARAGTILGYGQAISRTDYAGLFAAYSTTYGTGDGSTTFNLPDLRGRVVAGKDDMGGSAASRITNAGSSIVGTTLGAAGGLERQSTMDAPSTTQLVEGAAVTNPVSVAGQSHAHANFRVMQPTIIGNYAICL